MSYFHHRFDATISLHPVGRYNYTVVFLPSELASALPFAKSPRLRIEADVPGVPVLGAWQPSGGRWYLMLPKAGLKHAGLKIGSLVEVAFKLVAQDRVDLPDELEALLKREIKVKKAWSTFSAGKQRGLAYMVSSAKQVDTRQARLKQVRGVVLGELPEPWYRKAKQ